MNHALQIIKDKIHQTVIEWPKFFPETDDDTIERLDRLISVIRNQSIQINTLQNEREHILNKIHQLELQPIVSTSSFGLEKFLKNIV